MRCQRSNLRHATPCDVDYPNEVALLRLSRRGLCSCFSIFKTCRWLFRYQRGLEGNKLTRRERFPHLSAVLFEDSIERLVNKPDTSETMTISHHNDWVQSNRFQRV